VREVFCRNRARLALAMCATALVSLGSQAFSAEAPPDFVRDVQPIFVDHCYQCHGPDKQEAGLRLDQRDAALAGGDSGPLLVAG